MCSVLHSPALTDRALLQQLHPLLLPCLAVSLGASAPTTPPSPTGHHRTHILPLVPLLVSFFLVSLSLASHFHGADFLPSTGIHRQFGEPVALPFAIGRSQY